MASAWPSGEEELVLDRQVQYSSGLEYSRPDGFDYVQQLRSDEGGQIPIQVDLGLLSRTLWPYDFWTLTEKELDFIIK